MVKASQIENEKAVFRWGAEPENGFKRNQAFPFSFAGITQFRFGGCILSRPVPTSRNGMHP